MSGPIYAENRTAPNIELLLQQINTHEVRALYPVIIFYAIILIIGVIGNALVLMVYTFRYKRSPARVYILFLATIDLSICVFGLPYQLMDLTHPYTFKSSLMCKLLTFIVTTLFHMSIFGLIVIAVDRYLKICKPLGRLQLSYFGRKRACCAAIVCAVLLSWPNLVLYGLSEMDTPVENVTGHACFFETSYLETNYPFIYIMSTLIVCTGSTVFLIAAYALIFHQIYTRYQGVRFSVKFKKCAMDEISATDEVSEKSCSFGAQTVNQVFAESCEPLYTAAEPTAYSSVADGKDHDRIVEISGDERQLDREDTSTRPESTQFETDKELSDKIKSNPNAADIDITVDNNKDAGISNLLPTHNDACLQMKYHMKSNHANMQDDSMSNLYLKSCSSLTYNHFRNNPDTCNSETGDCSQHIPRLKIDKCVLNGNTEANDNLMRTYTASDSNVSVPRSQSNRPASACIPKHICELRGRTGTRLSLTTFDAFPKIRNRVICRSKSERFGNEFLGDKICKSNSFSSSKRLSRSVEIKNGDALRVHTGSISGSMIEQGNTINPAISRKHSKITKIMLTITTVFVLSYVPALIITIWCIVRPEIWDIISVTETVMFEFCLRFYLVNNVCNPFIYGFWDKRFKEEVYLTFGKLFNVCKVSGHRPTNRWSTTLE